MTGRHNYPRWAISTRMLRPPTRLCAAHPSRGQNGGRLIAGSVTESQQALARSSDSLAAYPSPRVPTEPPVTGAWLPCFFFAFGWRGARRPRRGRSLRRPSDWTRSMSGSPVLIIGGTRDSVDTFCVARLEGEVDEPADLAARDVGGDHLGAGVRDLLEVAQRGLRADLLQHRVHDALLAGHPRVVVGALTGAGEPQGVVAVELAGAGLDVAGHVAAEAADGDRRADVQGHAADGVDEVPEALRG